MSMVRCIAAGSLVLGMASPFEAMAENEALASKFIRCGFVLNRMAETMSDKTQANRANAASMMFITIGAPKAAGEKFVMAEMKRGAEAFAKELQAMRQRDPSPRAMAAFLKTQNEACRKLYSEHRERYFSR